MEIGHLFSKLKHTPKEESELFFAIQIDPEFVKTAIWTIRMERAEIVAFGSTSEWDGSSTQILIEAIDNSLSLALEKLPEGQQEPGKAVFGLPETWVAPDGVAAPRLADLKAVCEKLALKPLGFVVTTEAISQYLKSKEGTPLSAMLLQVSTSEVAVTIVHLGNIEGTHVAGRSGDLAADVREGVVRFGDRESLPSRMLLYDGGEDLQDLAQQLLAYDWQGSLPFLHIPKIEALEDTFSITAISTAGGAEVAKSLGFTISDVLSEQKPKVTDSAINIESVETAAPIVEAVTEVEDLRRDQQEAESEPMQEASEQIPEELKPKSAQRTTHPFKNIVQRAKNLLPHRFPRWRPSVSFSFLPQVHLTFVFVLIFIALIAFGVVVAAKQLPHASVTLTVQGQTVHQRLTMIASPSRQQVDPGEGDTLPAEKITLQKTKDESRETTGTKTTGEKAKGEVKIINKTNAVKKFASGTVITGPDGKEFTLDTDVTVASQSAQESSTGVTITFGTATSPATANGIGPEFNIDASTEFKVANLSPSAFLAKNDKGFSGGTKQEVRVVSKKDQSALKDDLISKIQEEAKQEIEAKSSQKRVFSETIHVSPTKQEYSADVGEEASNVSLILSADITALAIQQSDLQQLLTALLAQSVPEGFALIPDKITTQVEQVSEEGDGIKFDTEVSAQVSPLIDKRSVIDGIAGKRTVAASEFAKKLPYYKRFEVSIFPMLPPLIRWIPSRRDHIVYILKVED